MADQKPAPEKRKRLSESSVVRLWCYALFGVSSLMLMFSLSAGWNWRAWLVGTLIYGAFSLAMYRQEEHRKENLAVVRGAQASRAGTYDFSDDDEDDPTTPPQQRTR